ncbi:tripartite tricarboxylate transporter permease [Rhodobacter sp. NTK016B]|uniref:tripartite tricarboxylate transporter permease n=1 Tax=Rhodobacter sp. NTK016B TaxID=2759676 RepID=UPI001A8D6F20|nr:tripartite tricarboxylate transporter permease [Rhodobacter sp. NTK016B]MBN8293286.1 tripartite tricarboxylate transporter permease [Rhodobacter sp. NTK016B]
MTDLFSHIALGFSVAFSWQGIWWCFVGVTLGTFVGVLPGIGALAAIALLLPLTFGLEPTHALIMLAGIYYGSNYGGSTASILLNLPGTPSSAVTCLEGYPMAQNGRAGVALFITAIASFVGSIIGMIVMGVASPPLAALAMSFSGPDFFSLMVLGLVAASMLSSGSPLRGVAMIGLGLILGLVGRDLHSGLLRFSYGVDELYEGLPLVAVALGIFGLPEIIRNAGKIMPRRMKARDITFRSMIPTKDDWQKSRGAMLRGTGLGSFFGALPGTGGLLASFMSYAMEKHIAKEPGRFGKGAIEGIAGPEAANNAAVQTAFIPTLTLGIPGDVIMAIMMGAMIIHGIQPGAAVITSHPDLFWGLLVSFLIGNFLLLVLNIPLIGLWVRMLSIPYSVLYPFIVAFICIGVYSVNSSVTDLYVLLFFGVLGVVMAFLKFEPAPLVLGLILGPMMEENLRRTLTLHRGDYSVFVTRPISAIFLTAALLIVVLTIWSAYRNRGKRDMAQESAAE